MPQVRFRATVVDVHTPHNCIAVGGGVVDDLVCVESADQDGPDDDLGTYEVVDFTEGGGRR